MDDIQETTAYGLSALTTAATALATIIAVLLGIYFVTKNARKAKRDTFLIAGLSEAGKTVLYAKLRYGKSAITHTSMTENEGWFTPEPPSKSPSPKTRPVHLVDLPGHEKLRFKYTEYIPITAGIIFLIDSITLSRNVRVTAEYLYDILSNRFTIRNEVPVLVLCNKSDFLLALKAEKIKAMLEEEMDRLRTTRSSKVQSQDDECDEEFIGQEGKPFKFEHLPNQIIFQSGSLLHSAEKSDSGIKIVNDFLVQRIT
ncbi:signal recognition particle receptor beta subunit-domain-containing protein [Phlyctochytrium arcticum]|nr:signal recognition particle receptor beta subunit-domain-containing protein [Phlyctochytrium arcticum]